MSYKQCIVLIIYDIVDTKVRNKMVSILESYAVRVQKSAFEGLLDKKQYESLLKKISHIIDPSVDSLRVYILDDVVNVYTWGIGNRKESDCVIV